MSPEMLIVRRMCLYYGVEPSRAEAPEHTRDVLSLVSRFALDRGLARRGQRMIVVTGRPIGLAGASNTIVVHTVL